MILIEYIFTVLTFVQIRCKIINLWLFLYISEVTLGYVLYCWFFLILQNLRLIILQWILSVILPQFCIILPISPNYLEILYCKWKLIFFNWNWRSFIEEMWLLCSVRFHKVFGLIHWIWIGGDLMEIFYFLFS